MKKDIMLLFSLLVCSISFGQKNQPNTTLKSSFHQMNIHQIPTLDFSVAFTKKSGNSFSLYNTRTGLNDSFNKYRDFYSYSKSTLVFTNQFRGIKVDSLNPYGAVNPGA
jgi:hypothetical protein